MTKPDVDRVLPVVAVVAACLVALVAAWATWLTDRHLTRPAPVVSTPELRAAERVSARADHLYAIIEGTGSQQDAAEYVPYRRVNDRIAACTRAAELRRTERQWRHVVRVANSYPGSPGF